MSPEQFDICRVFGLRSGSPVDLAVVLQDETLSHLVTRIIAPVVQVDEEFDVDRTTLAADIHGVRYMIAVHLLTTIPRRNLGGVVATVKHMERQLKSAIDMAFFGI